jgi:hypothetical protein
MLNAHFFVACNICQDSLVSCPLSHAGLPKHGKYSRMTILVEKMIINHINGLLRHHIVRQTHVRWLDPDQPDYCRPLLHVNFQRSLLPHPFSGFFIKADVGLFW